MTQNQNPEKTGNSRISKAIGIEVKNFYQYDDGFSFTVESELDAYKAAYAYRFGEVVVNTAPNLSPTTYIVQVYKK